MPFVGSIIPRGALPPERPNKRKPADEVRRAAKAEAQERSEDEAELSSIADPEPVRPAVPSRNVADPASEESHDDRLEHGLEDPQQRTPPHQPRHIDVEG
jgi:hypothetical protein